MLCVCFTWLPRSENTVGGKAQVALNGKKGPGPDEADHVTLLVVDDSPPATIQWEGKTGGWRTHWSGTCNIVQELSQNVVMGKALFWPDVSCVCAGQVPDPE